MPKVVRLLRREKGLPARIEKINPDEPDLFLSLLSAGDMGIGSESGCINRGKLYAALGINPDRVHFLRQVHSKKILVSGSETGNLAGPAAGGPPAAGTSTAEPAAGGPPAAGIPAAGPGPDRPEGDGLINGAGDHILAVTVADCMPIYLFHRRSGRFALLHSGWKGTGIAAEAVRIFRDRYGLPVVEISAVLGPSIRSCCYRVDEARAELFEGLWGAGSVERRDGTGGTVGPDSPGGEFSGGFGGGVEPYLDLVTANLGALQKIGLKDIRVVDECTACGAGRNGTAPAGGEVDLGSFRREGSESFTRMLAMIGFFN